MGFRDASRGLQAGGGVAADQCFDSVLLDCANEDVRLQRSGAKVLTVDDGAGGAATLSVPGAGNFSEQFGSGATTTGAAATGATAIGNIAQAGLAGTAIGYNARATQTGTVAIGYGAECTDGGGATAVGYAADADDYATAIGYAASCTHRDSTIIGSIASDGGFEATCIGRAATATAALQLVAGSVAHPITTAYVGEGVVSATPQALSLNATGGSGTNIAAGAFQIAGGRSTGNATAGILELQTGTPGVSGTTAQTLATRLTLTDTAATLTVPLSAPSVSKISNGTAITATDTAEAGERVLYNPTGGTFQISAPASPVIGTRFAVKNRSASVVAVTISGNGNDIEDPTASFAVAASFTLAGDGIAAEWEFDGTDWLAI